MGGGLERGDHCREFSLESFEECGWLGALERFLIYLREERAYFLRKAASVRSDVFGFLVGRCRDRRCGVSSYLEES